MYKGKKILALIPARGGSKGLPRKNILELLGKPLITWSIEQALRSAIVDKVVVSTDSSEIAKISKEYGAEVPFLRPVTLATDKATSVDVVLHGLDYFRNEGIEYDYLALLEPTSPLRKDGDIDAAIRSLIDDEAGFDGLVSLGKIALENPVYAKKIDQRGNVAPYYSNEAKDITHRQDLPVAHFPYGVIYLVKTDTLRKELTFYPKRTKSYLIERWQNYEVDDIYDLECIKVIMSMQKGVI
jgi:CMP-N-acetylneuraminic acid synthetase